jgi:high-affinity Fe2+/Pb2+ permease
VKTKSPLFDPRRHRQTTETRLIMGGFLVLLVIGVGLVWAFYGGGSALAAATCLLVGAGLFGLLWGILTLLGWWANRRDDL